MERLLFDSVYYVGACDKTKTLFENLFPIPEGMRYNSYLIKDEKTALLDTADAAVREEFLENVGSALQGKALDYLVIHHVEPDHSALVSDILRMHPETTIVTSATALKFLNQFTDSDLTDKTKIVKEGDTLSLGAHSLSFIAAPMVHWPEVLVSYDAHCKTLFSADAFGSFGSRDGSLFISSLSSPSEWENEARRYYTNIVGRFGTNVMALLKKASALDIEKICPLHGFVFDKHCDFAIEKYTKWGSYIPESDGALIVYGSMYGNTKKAADRLAAELAKKNINSKTYDVSYTDLSYIISDCFKYGTFVFACPTYYGLLFPKMEQVLTALKKIGLSNRHIAFIENGTWAATAIKQMKDILLPVTADISLPSVSFKSSPNDATYTLIEDLASKIAEKQHFSDK